MQQISKQARTLCKEVESLRTRLDAVLDDEVTAHLGNAIESLEAFAEAMAAAEL